VVNIISEQ